MSAKTKGQESPVDIFLIIFLALAGGIVWENLLSFFKF